MIRDVVRICLLGLITPGPANVFAQAPPDANSPPVDVARQLLEQMETAERLLRLGDSGSIASQQQVLDRLDALLSQVSSDSSESSGKQPSSRDNSSGQTSQPGQAAAGETAGQGASGRHASDSESANGISVRQSFSERSWGHLPPEVRNRLQAVVGEQFLPGYEKQIEAYYRRLSEQAK
ncbi:MAG: hypothetical protein KDA87_00255 [Planctomycetales bacterium]|nr:hypothetical protein [Planctomycetales bacterium]